MKSEEEKIKSSKVEPQFSPEKPPAAAKSGLPWWSAILFLWVGLVLARDVFAPAKAPAAPAAPMDPSAPARALPVSEDDAFVGDANAAPLEPAEAYASGEQFRVRVQFCTSCGMVRNFRALSEFLETRYPELRGQVHGSNYPAPPHALMAVQAAQLSQWAAIGLMVGGSTLFNALGLPEPEWYEWMKENKVSTFVGVFFANSVANSMTATGAFEVAVDGRVVYSKLASGRMPTARDLVQSLEGIGLHAIDA